MRVKTSEMLSSRILSLMEAVCSKGVGSKVRAIFSSDLNSPSARD